MHYPEPDPLLPWAPDGLSLCLVQAACEALEIQRSSPPRCKPDGTLVTAADLAVEAAITRFLGEQCPEDHIIGEESLDQKDAAYRQACFEGRSWVIDPIDGTVLFAMGMAGWGISLGLMENAVLKHGVVVFPQRLADGSALQFLWSGEDGTAHRSDAFIPHGHAPEATSIFMLQCNQTELRQLPPVENYPGLIAVSQRVAKNTRYRGRHSLISLGSCVASFRHLMDGGISAYLVKLKLWDVAAVLAIAWPLGIRACLVDGTPLSLDIRQAAWITDPVAEHFLGLEEHVFFYRSERMDPQALADFSWD